MSLLLQSLNIPVLETERVLLRGHRLTDFEDCVSMWADNEVTRFIGKPSTPQQTWSRLLSYLGHWNLMGFGYWAIEDKHTGEFLGEAGFADFKRDLHPPLKGNPELGWALVSKIHGKGIATEVLQAAVAWGDKAFKHKTMVSIISPDNLASRRVAEKAGFQEIQQTTYLEKPILLYSRKSQHRSQP